MYKLVKDNLTNSIDSVFKIDENLCIPMNLDNIDYQAYLKWLEEGGVPTPADEGVA